MDFTPRLAGRDVDGLHVEIDEGALERGVLVAFTDRHGGHSVGPFESLNLAARVGDDPDVVTRNRRQVGRALGFDADRLALARQVHGTTVLEVTPGASGVVGSGDGLVAREPGVVLGILTADCAPVVVLGDEGVAIAHAGWRGLEAGVVAQAVAAVGRPIAGWIGPSIHACCYAVGPEVVEAWRAAGLPTAGDDRVDPGRAAAVALRRAGVERIASVVECTSCDRSYFSYRRDGLTGRQGAFAALLATDASSA